MNAKIIATVNVAEEITQESTLADFLVWFAVFGVCHNNLGGFLSGLESSPGSISLPEGYGHAQTKPALGAYLYKILKSKDRPGNAFDTIQSFPEEFVESLINNTPDEIIFANSNDLIEIRNASGPIGTAKIGYPDRLIGQLISTSAQLCLAGRYMRGLKIQRSLRDYAVEGLLNSVVEINGDVGEYCGKHSYGGKVVIRGNAGKAFGSVSKNVHYIVYGNIKDVDQIKNCTVEIYGQVEDKDCLQSYADENTIFLAGEKILPK